LVALALVVTVLFVGTTLVSARGHTDQTPSQGGGGYLKGYVYGFNMWDQFITIPWAPVKASNGQLSFVAYSGDGGVYEMFLPGGDYNVTVTTPGYTPQSIPVSVSDGSSSTINFYLYQSHVPVPEFPLGTLSIIMVVALTGALLAKRATKRKPHD
jgi:hypothetical protein